MIGAVRRVVDATFRGQTSDSVTRSLRAAASGTFVLNVAALVFNFVGLVALTRTLGEQAFGAYSYALAWAIFLVVPAVGGLPHLLVRELAAYETRREGPLARGLIRRSYQVTLAASAAVVAVAGAAGALLMGDEHDVRATFLLGLLLVPLLAFIRIGEGVLRGFRRVSHGRLPETTVQPLLLLALVLGVAAVAGGDVGAPTAMALTVAATGAAVGTAQLLVRWAVPRRVGRAEPAYDTGPWFRSARSLFFLSGAQVLQVQVVLILAGALGAVSDSGIVSTALRWAAAVGFMQIVVNLALAPAIARLHAAGSHDELQRILSTSARVVTAVAAPAALLLVVLAKPALEVFGDGFARGSTALAVLVAAELFNAASGSVVVALMMTHHEDVVATASGIALAMTVVLAFALIPPFGVTGAALARGVSLVALNVVLLVQLWRRERIFPAVVGGRLIGGLRRAP